MAKTALLVRIVGDHKYLTRLEVQDIRFAFRWTAVDGKRLVAPWTSTIERDVDRRHVLVSTRDGRVAVTAYVSIVGFLEDLDDPSFVHANQSVCVNVRRIEKMVCDEGYLVYFPGGTARPQDRELIKVSRRGQRDIVAVLEGGGPRRAGLAELLEDRGG